MMKIAKNAFLAVVATTCLTACVPTVSNRGNMPTPQDIARLQPGVTSRTDVLTLLGTPTSTSTFDKNIWYYIGQRTEQVSFFRPEVVAHQAIGVSFDNAGTLDAIVVSGKDKYNPVSPISKATPTAGKKLTLIEQMIGNVGRFNNANKNGQQPGGIGSDGG
jgi:outer membrane protein assembly factor BamE (lipoprotein component of BamABCDE complex)